MTSSPKKSPKKAAHGQSVVFRSSYADQFFEQRENASLQIDLKKAHLEIEDVSNTLVALNLKFVVQSDLQMDVQQHKKMLAEGEAARDSLHVKVRELTATHAA